ncbi:MAG: tetratricopeptide repeat protein [Candidatus Synoicihabitans palmerolidicus]|nr:tetratricopeptide repeat protein [Candidatus Synoicihabitans palmerolidicus]
MSKPDPTPAAPSTADQNLVSADTSAASPDFEEVVRQFWQKNRTAFVAVAAVVIVMILGRHGLTIMKESQSSGAREAYAATITDAERMVFAKENAGTQLAGAAWLEVGDTAFAEARYGDAIAAYDSASEELAGTVFADRIALGRAMAQIQNGDASTGQAALQSIANNTDFSGAVRGEAAYHLASIAAAADNRNELTSLATQITSLDPSSTWSQRVIMLQATMAPVDATAGDVSFVSP